jgi:hypothetical protein
MWNTIKQQKGFSNSVKPFIFLQCGYPVHMIVITKENPLLFTVFKQQGIPLFQKTVSVQGHGVALGR